MKFNQARSAVMAYDNTSKCNVAAVKRLQVADQRLMCEIRPFTSDHTVKIKQSYMDGEDMVIIDPSLRVVCYFHIPTFTKPVSNQSKKMLRAVSTCRMNTHDEHQKYSRFCYQKYKQTNLFINISINTTIYVLAIAKSALIKYSKYCSI